MKQKYIAYFDQNATTARIDLIITFNNDNELSEEAKKRFEKYEDFLAESENDTIKIPKQHTNRYVYNCDYFLGNLLASDDPFVYLKNLFIGVSEMPLYFFKYQVSCAEKDYKEYISYNNFTLDFFDRFINSKRITISRKMLDYNFQPLSIDNDTSNIIYCYESTDIKDIIFSNIHFALNNGYKFIQCAHCGRWFFKSGGVINSRTKYCKRKSPFKGYEHLECEQAVRNINQQCSRIKKRIRNRLEYRMSY